MISIRLGFLAALAALVQSPNTSKPAPGGEKIPAQIEFVKISPVWQRVRQWSRGSELRCPSLLATNATARREQDVLDGGSRMHPRRI